MPGLMLCTQSTRSFAGSAVVPGSAAWVPCAALTCVVVTSDLLKVARHLRGVPGKLLPEGVDVLLHLEEGPESTVHAFSCKAEATRLAISRRAEAAVLLRTKGSLNSFSPFEHGKKYHATFAGAHCTCRRSIVSPGVMSTPKVRITVPLLYEAAVRAAWMLSSVSMACVTTSCL